MVDRPNGDGDRLFVDGAEAAFVTGVLAAATVAWRAQGQSLIAHAKRMPLARRWIKSDLRAARRLMHECGRALILTANAIDQALEMPADSPVARVNADKLEEAILCFAKYVDAQERGAAVFQSIIGKALVATPPAGHA